MVISIESGFVIGSLLATVTVCLVKLISQLENSRCTNIKCCGVQCDRDLSSPVQEVETENIPVIPPAPAPPPKRPRLVKPSVEELRARYE